VDGETVIRVLAAVVRRQNKLLVCKRPAHKRHGGLWEFPGGKVEVGESNLEALGRELSEELDVTVISVGEMQFSTQDPGSEFVIEFIPTDIAGDPICLEHSELSWVRIEDLLSLPLAPSDRKFSLFLLRSDEGRDA
jgi:mutator protein MutT